MIEQDVIRRDREYERMDRDRNNLITKENLLLIRSRELDLQDAELKHAASALKKERAEFATQKTKFWEKRSKESKGLNPRRSYDHDVSDPHRGRNRDRNPLAAYTRPDHSTAPDDHPAYSIAPLQGISPRSSSTATAHAVHMEFARPSVNADRILPRPHINKMHIPYGSVHKRVPFASTSQVNPDLESGPLLAPILLNTAETFAPNDRPSSPITTSGGETDHASVTTQPSPYRSRYGKSKTPDYTPRPGNDRDHEENDPNPET
jgi:hypothetical protein